MSKKIFISLLAIASILPFTGQLTASAENSSTPTNEIAWHGGWGGGGWHGGGGGWHGGWGGWRGGGWGGYPYYGGGYYYPYYRSYYPYYYYSY